MAALIFHALFPRYEVHLSPRVVRVDRWTGTASGFRID